MVEKIFLELYLKQKKRWSYDNAEQTFAKREQ